MRDLLSFVDPFFGNGTIDLPTPEGIAATWFFIKAQTGNTHPGACAPFGMVSACAYSGAYPTGYGKNAPNYNSAPPQRFDEFVASGFTHLHQSGTGAIGTYYNYFRVTPLPGGLERLGTSWVLADETASPGYYAATLGDTGIRAELTASPRAACHRYTFARGDTPQIVVDLSVGGIDFPRMRTYPTEARIEILSGNAAQGHVLMAGIPLHVYVEADAPGSTCALWVNRSRLGSQGHLALPHITEDDFQPFGVVFRAEAGDNPTVHVRLGFSLRSVEQARCNVHEIALQSFDQVARETRQMWSEHIGRIQVSGGSDAQRTILYSSLYHSLAKPADWRGESPFWSDDPFYVDLATMWDQYKTQLPLVLTLYPERGRDLVNSLLSLAEYAGGFPNGLILDADVEQFENQARALAHYTLADAYYRHLDGIDWRRALSLMVADLRRARNADFWREGIVYPVTHTLDLAGACFCIAQIAAGLGETSLHEEMMALSTRWRNVYDPSTGKLVEAQYYEGGLWNYSFRLLHDMAGRIALYPAEADFVADLDRFFGYGQPPVVQSTDPANRDYMRWGHSLNRFEGYNNEPDIETPYGYLYAGRHDRAAEVVRAGMKYLFTTGRGGLPGNNDSGGLTSCYVWNAVGLFPVTGQPVFLIGSPIFDAASLHVGDKTFTVETVGSSDDSIYVQAAALNGQPIDRAFITVDELLQGGR